MRITMMALTGVLLISACSKKNDTPPTDPVTTVNYSYLVSQEKHNPYPHIAGVANFDYNGTTISRRTGYYTTSGDPSTITSFVFGSTVTVPITGSLPPVNGYDDMEYINNNLIKITSKS